MNRDKFADKLKTQTVFMLNDLSIHKPFFADYPRIEMHIERDVALRTAEFHIMIRISDEELRDLDPC